MKQGTDYYAVLGCIGYLEHPFEKETALGFDDPPLSLCHMVLSQPKYKKIVHM